MDEMQTAKRICLECGSEKYLFRGRKKIPAENGQAEAMGTRYRKKCEHIRTLRTPKSSSPPMRCIRGE